MDNLDNFLRNLEKIDFNNNTWDSISEYLSSDYDGGDNNAGSDEESTASSSNADDGFITVTIFCYRASPTR